MHRFGVLQPEWVEWFGPGCLTGLNMHRCTNRGFACFLILTSQPRTYTSIRNNGCKEPKPLAAGDHVVAVGACDDVESLNRN